MTKFILLACTILMGQAFAQVVIQRGSPMTTKEAVCFQVSKPMITDFSGESQMHAIFLRSVGISEEAIGKISNEFSNDVTAACSPQSVLPAYEVPLILGNALGRICHSQFAAGSRELSKCIAAKERFTNTNSGYEMGYHAASSGRRGPEDCTGSVVNTNRNSSPGDRAIVPTSPRGNKNVNIQQ